MMKKILAAAACAAMVLSLAGCGKSENPPANQPQNSAGNTVSTPKNSTPDTASTTSTSSEPDSIPEENGDSSTSYAREKDFEVEDVDGGVGITKYLGNEAVVNIPPTIGGKKVVGVSFSGARYGEGNAEVVSSIIIPDGVTEILDFSYFKNLTSVSIPDSVTKIGWAAFAECKSLTSVTIPDGVTEICGSTFAECRSLESITIPDSVTKIDMSAFRYCSSLTSITIPDSVTEIGIGAFEGCSSLTSITIPDSVTKIDDDAFASCKKIKVTYKGKEYNYDNIDEICKIRYR